jgi:hypothetical protein
MLVLDGELAIFDEKLRSRFDWLRRGPESDAVATPPVFIASTCCIAPVRTRQSGLYGIGACCWKMCSPPPAPWCCRLDG